MLDFIVENGTQITKRMLFALTNQNIDPYNISGFRQDRNDVGVKIIERVQSSGEIHNSSDPVLLFNNVQAQTIGLLYFGVPKWVNLILKMQLDLQLKYVLILNQNYEKHHPVFLLKVN